MRIEINKEVECFLPVVGYEGLYEVSNLGRIKSLRKKIMNNGVLSERKEIILAKRKDGSGYPQVYLYNNNHKISIKVHKIVYETYIGSIDKKLQINHLNGIKDDNRIENLEQITAKENVNHSFNVLKRKPSGGRKHKPVIQFDKNKRL